jgi:hypothetical protein
MVPVRKDRAIDESNSTLRLRTAARTRLYLEALKLFWGSNGSHLTKTSLLRFRRKHRASAERFVMRHFSKPGHSPATPVLGSPMNKLIRSKATRQFLTIDGHWTGKLDHAGHFPDQAVVHDVVDKFHLHDVELYYLFGEHVASQYDFTIPLR